MNTKFNALVLILLLSTNSIIKAEETGKATVNNGLKNGGGNCSFKWTLDTPRHITGVSSKIYDSSKACGGCMRVTANGKSVEVFVTDSMGGDEYDLNLPTEAFEEISGQNSGVIDVTWEWIECPVKYSDLHYHFQENSNENYFAFQVIDHKFKVEKIVLKINDEYKDLVRQDYNYFVYQ